MHKTAMKQVVAVVVFSVPLASALAGNYDATDENGVRIFSKVPEPGVHPRVILSPEDLPAWRKQVIETYRGKEFFSKRFESKKVIDVLAAIDAATPERDLVKAYPSTSPGDNHDLLYATMDVVYHQDEAKAEKVCRAVASFARVVLARSKHEPAWGKVEQNIGDIKGNTGIRTGLGELWCRGGADFALAYDFLFNYMTTEQQDVCRKALSVATRDLICWGMNFPRGRGVSNWYGYHGELGPMLLAIEGEQGYRPEQWETFKEMIRNWAEVHIYEEGGSNEDGYTINTSLREGQFTLIAMARRGENHYTRPNIRNYFKWLVLSLVPGEETGDTVGYSSSRASPYESAPVLARWAMPGDKLVNYYFMRYKGKDYQLQDRWQYASWSTLLCMNYEDSAGLPLDMGKLGLPATHVFPYQGLFITRSDWSDEAAYLNVLARQDAWYDRHENVDRGRFVFAAHGRRWAIDRPWGTAQRSEDHNLVHIDGKAQVEAKLPGARGKAPNARLIKHGDFDASGKQLTPTGSENPGAYSYAVLDLGNAYNWMWVHSWDKPGEGWEPECRSFKEIGWPWKRAGQPERLHGCDNRVVPKYNFLGCNFWRKPYNPVEKAYRIACLVRGHHPYAIIADDIKKDGAPHDYGWYMQLPLDLEEKGQSGNDIVLGEIGEKQQDGKPVKGSRRMLVRFVSPQNISVKVAQYELGTNKYTGKPIMANRLIGSIKSVEPRFKVMLFPYLEGEVLPRTRLSGATLTVAWDDQTDTLTFESPAGEPSDISVRQNLSKRTTPIDG